MNNLWQGSNDKGFVRKNDGLNFFVPFGHRAFPMTFPESRFVKSGAKSSPRFMITVPILSPFSHILASKSVLQIPKTYWVSL